MVETRWWDPSLRSWIKTRWQVYMKYVGTEGATFQKQKEEEKFSYMERRQSLVRPGWKFGQSRDLHNAIDCAKFWPRAVKMFIGEWLHVIGSSAT